MERTSAQKALDNMDKLEKSKGEVRYLESKKGISCFIFESLAKGESIPKVIGRSAVMAVLATLLGAPMYFAKWAIATFAVVKTLQWLGFLSG